MTKEDIVISHHNYDIIFKSLTGTFAEQTLEIFGVNTAPIKWAEKTELPQIKIDERRMDFAFYLADDTYLHLEFQFTSCTENLERFMLYDTALYEARKKNIHTVVIYGGSIKNAQDYLDHGSVKYQVQNVYMYQYDGDATYQELQNKIEQQERLAETDQLKLIFLPLMKNSVNKSQRAIEAVELAKLVRDEQQQTFLIGTLVGITDKFIDKEYVRRLMEVLRMTKVGRELYNEGITEGMAEGELIGIAKGKMASRREVIKDYLEAKFGFDSLGLQEKVNQINSMDILDRLPKRLFTVEKLESAEAIIEEALKAQAKVKQPQ